MKRRPVTIALCMLLGAPGVYAANWGYEVSAGLAESDNILRTPASEESGTIASVGLELNWLEKREHLNGDVAANLDYVDYLDDTYDSELIGNLIGQMRAALVPQRLIWAFSDRFGQNRVNPLVAVTPDNRENINYFSTGPDINFPLGSVVLLTLSGRYSNVNYETSPFDNRRLSGGAGLQRGLSDATRVSLNASGERVEFEDATGGEDYDRSEAFIRYDALGSRTKLGIDLGYTRLKQEADSSSGLVARMQVSRQMSPSSIVAASFGREYSDAGNSFVLLQALGGAGLETQSVLQTSNPFTNNYATFAWNFDRHRTGMGLEISRFDESYRQFDTLDRTRLQGGVQVRRDLTPNVRATLLGAYAREDFDNIVGDSRETSASALLTWRPGRNWSFSLQYEHLQRDSDIPTSEYTENRGWLRVGFGRRATMPEGPAVPPLPSEANF